MNSKVEERIGVVGLGYVGLPLALALARRFAGTVGFDINSEKVALIRQGVDVLGEGIADELSRTTLRATDDPAELAGCTFIIVGVPTPVDKNHRPDLRPLTGACRLIGPVLGRGAVVVFESTVYPGVTEDICGPILEELSGLKQGVDFKLGYSPERMNPGDPERTVEKIIKVVAGQDADTLARVTAVYKEVITAGLHQAPSIKVAEAAKVIENTQRDLNIALMNELAIIFDRMEISTRDVLRAAQTKWNFLPFTPGLVGGHCIGVDPYYLTSKAEQLGYHPQVILAGRRINDGMGVFVAQRTVKLLANACFQIKGARVAVFGLTFKENVADLRNSRVPDIVSELREFGVEPLVHDPVADAKLAEEEYGIKLTSWDEIQDVQAVIIAVSHRYYCDRSPEEFFNKLLKGGVVIDIKSVFEREQIPPDLIYWSL